jgi:hypothetical protein
MMNPTKEAVTVASVAPAVRRGGRNWASARFAACVGLLGLAAAAVQIVPGLIGVFLRKDAVPLKKPLQHLDMGQLGPRYTRDPDTDTLAPLSSDVIEGLGTSEYVQILIADQERPKNDPMRVARVFVTYYTGQPDMVPHVPDECYTAGGWDPVGASNVTVRVRGIGAPDDEVPVRVMQFRTAARRRAAFDEAQVLTVMYFFHVSGGYTCTRDGVRSRLTNPFQRFAYYAKIEVNFPAAAALGTEEGRRVSLEALGPLLERLMPVLIHEHFDLRAFGGEPSTQPSSS